MGYTVFEDPCICSTHNIRLLDLKVLVLALVHIIFHAGLGHFSSSPSRTQST